MQLYNTLMLLHKITSYTHMLASHYAQASNWTLVIVSSKRVDDIFSSDSAWELSNNEFLIRISAAESICCQVSQPVYVLYIIIEKFLCCKFTFNYFYFQAQVKWWFTKMRPAKRKKWEMIYYDWSQYTILFLKQHIVTCQAHPALVKRVQ